MGQPIHPEPEYEEVEAEIVEDEAFDESEEEPVVRKRKRRRKRPRYESHGNRTQLIVLGIFMLLVALPWTGLGVFNLLLLMAEGIIAFAQDNPFADQQKLNNPFYIFGVYLGAIMGPITGLLMLGGAISMLVCKLRPLAIVGSIAAMLPCSICCIAGLPLGIWGLVLLNQQDTVDLFS